MIDKKRTFICECEWFMYLTRLRSEDLYFLLLSYLTRELFIILKTKMVGN